MRIYLAGPMRGIENFNFPAFHSAAAKLRIAGFDVFNPAEADISTYGPKIADSSGDEVRAAAAVGLSPLELKRQVFKKDTTAICEWADALGLLPNWEYSLGVKAEVALAEAIGLPIFDVEYLLDPKNSLLKAA